MSESAVSSNYRPVAGTQVAAPLLGGHRPHTASGPAGGCCTVHCTGSAVSTIYLRYDGYPKHGKVMVTLNTEAHKLVSENHPTNCRFCELTKDGADATIYWYARA